MWRWWLSLLLYFKEEDGVDDSDSDNDDDDDDGAGGGDTTDIALSLTLHDVDVDVDSTDDGSMRLFGCCCCCCFLDDALVGVQNVIMESTMRMNGVTYKCFCTEIDDDDDDYDDVQE
jgi:hypothetical protein